MNILITGASSGIGRYAAIHLGMTSTHTVFILARTQSGLEETIAIARERGAKGHFEAIVGDLNQLNQELLSDRLAQIPHLDTLINNAGCLVHKPFMETTTQDWNDIWAVNLMAPVELTKLVMPWLRKSERAHIVNISSMGGVQGSAKFSGLAAYSSAKGALSILTECMAEEFKDQNISVNCLALGAVQTQMLETAFPGIQAPVDADTMGMYLANFALNGHLVYNGKVLPVSLSTP
jgi:NAD(P)-dependent dehydrogenase (short-subunit alcohol dehydrogenase family)